MFDIEEIRIEELAVDGICGVYYQSKLSFMTLGDPNWININNNDMLN